MNRAGEEAESKEEDNLCHYGEAPLILPIFPLYS